MLGTFFDISDLPSPALNYTANLINDFKPILGLIIGILIGIIVITLIISALKH